MKHRLMPLLAGLALAAGCASLTTAHAQQAPLAADPAAVHFDITRFDVRGNTLLTPQDINSAVAPYTGRGRDFADVMGALEQLEAAYHSRGYQLVRVDLPEQELDQGVVVFNVVQVKVGRVRIEGNQYYDDANVRHALPSLREGEVPNIAMISKRLKLANENPSRKIVMSLQNADEGDNIDVKLGVTDESPWSTSLNVSNTGSAATGRTQAGVVLQNANLFGLDHVLNLQYTTTLERPNSVSVYGIGYHIPLYELGDSLDFFGNYSNVDSGTVTAGIFNIAVSGKGTTFGGRYNHNLTNIGTYESKIIYGVDYKAFKSSVQLLGIELGNDVTVHPVSIGYQSNWALASSAFTFGASLSQNIPGGSNGAQSDFTRARANATDSYRLARFSASVTQALPSDWQGRLILNGQYTNDALIPGEQFGAGGSTSVRGFDEREISNDSGIAGNLELYTPQLCTSSDWNCKLLGFYDAAHVTRNNALPGEFQNISISSIGLGMRINFRRNVDFQVDVGHALRAQATTTQAGDNRVHVRLGLTF